MMWWHPFIVGVSCYHIWGCDKCLLYSISGKIFEQMHAQLFLSMLEYLILYIHFLLWEVEEQKIGTLHSSYCALPLVCQAIS